MAICEISLSVRIFRFLTAIKTVALHHVASFIAVRDATSLVGHAAVSHRSPPQFFLGGWT